MDNEFEKVYEKILNKSGSDLREMRRKKNRYFAWGFLIAVLLDFLSILIFKDSIIPTLTIIITGVVVLLMYYKADKDYRKTYKKAVIEEIIKSYDENLEFNPDEGLTDYDYSASSFDKDFKETVSEDKVYGKILEDTDFKMAQIISYSDREYRDNDGNTQKEKVKTFDGMYGVVRMEVDSGNTIHIKEAESTFDARIARMTRKKVEMDSQEFENYYDLYSDNRMQAYKIFTPDILLDFVDLPKRNMTHFEVKIENDMFYFRYRCGEVFEPPKFKDPLDKETMHKYYNTIVFPIDLTKKIVKNIYDYT